MNMSPEFGHPNTYEYYENAIVIEPKTEDAQGNVNDASPDDPPHFYGVYLMVFDAPIEKMTANKNKKELRNATI
jgi:hypothetical protein